MKNKVFLFGLLAVLSALVPGKTLTGTNVISSSAEVDKTDTQNTTSVSTGHVERICELIQSFENPGTLIAVTFGCVGLVLYAFRPFIRAFHARPARIENLNHRYGIFNNDGRPFYLPGEARV